MLKGLIELDEAGLAQWIDDSLAQNSNILSAGLQGQTLIYKDEYQSLVIKVPHGTGLMRLFHVRMLRHEYDVYKKLEGLVDVPRCYGMVKGQYLILEYINGRAFRQGRPGNEARYFRELLQAIKNMHERQVAHMDLKKRDNLLVVDDQAPCIIDFGAAVIRKPGFHPVNHFWYNLARKFDYNAWIKLKYNNQFHLISDEDLPYYNKTKTEIIAHKIKRFYKDRVKKLFSR